MARWFSIGLFVAVSLACDGVGAQSTNEYIIAARRMGTIDFIDPATLRTLSSIEVQIPPTTTGLDGVFLDPDGRTLYVEGPIGGYSAVANGCCWLYSIDLATLQAKQVAGIWGSKSRRAFITAGPGLLQRLSETPSETTVDHQAARVPLPDSSEASACSAWPPFTNSFIAESDLVVYEVFGEIGRAHV